MNIYAGIGSRRTPKDVCLQMTAIATKLHIRGWMLRSGGAEGADTAFAAGSGGVEEIFKARDATPAALALSSRFHPAWGRLNSYVQALHARNAQILLGRTLRRPVKFVICWTPRGEETGGTGQAIRIASAYNIPVFNLAHVGWFEPNWLDDAITQYGEK